MLNHIWAFLIIVGILVGFGTAIRTAQVGEQVKKVVDGKEVTETVVYPTVRDKLKAISDSGNKLAKEVFRMVGEDGAVGIAIGYIGLIAFWLGLMRIAEAAGLISALSRMIAPLFRFIFPDVPRDHPASGAILMNFAANMLGLDNAATPLGIKAMKELQSLNPRKDTASNSMCMFLALNVSSLTLIPASVIALRATEKSVAPTSFYPVMLIATAVGTVTAFVLCKLAERFWSPAPPPDPDETGSANEESVRA